MILLRSRGGRRGLILLRSREGGRGSSDTPEKERMRKKEGAVIFLRRGEGGRGESSVSSEKRRRSKKVGGGSDSPERGEGGRRGRQGLS